MDYFKIGLSLKRARERKGLSYEQIFEITRIQPSVLKGIEEGSAPVAPVFLKSFVKKYARFLALDPERLFKEAEEDSKSKEETQRTAKKAGQSKARLTKSHLRHVLPLLGLFIAFQAFRLLYSSDKPGEREGLGKGQTAVGDLADGPPAGPSGRELSKTKPAESPGRTNFPKEGPKLKAAAESKPADKKTGLFDQIKSGLFPEDILIRSSEPNRLYFKADGQSTVTKILEPSVWFQIKAKNSVYLRIDERRGDILIFHNGRQADMGDKPFFERTFKH